MNTNPLRYLLALREYGTISAAAGSLFITPSALSQCLSNEEERQGCALFERLNGRFLPTRKGEVYLSYAEKIVAVQDRAMQVLQDPAVTAKHHTVRIALSYTFEGFLLTSAIPQLEKMFPDCSFELHPDHSQTSKDRLLDGLCDLAIYSLPYSGNTLLKEQVFGEEHFIAMVSNNAPLLGDPLELPSYRAARFVLYRHGTKTRSLQNQLLAMNGCPTVKRVIEVDNYNSCVHMTSSIDGVTLVPSHLLKLLPESCRILELEHTYVFHQILACAKTHESNETLSAVRDSLYQLLLHNETTWIRATLYKTGRN